MLVWRVDSYFEDLKFCLGFRPFEALSASLRGAYTKPYETLRWPAYQA